MNEKTNNTEKPGKRGKKSYYKDSLKNHSNNPKRIEILKKKFFKIKNKCAIKVILSNKSSIEENEEGESFQELSNEIGTEFDEKNHFDYFKGVINFEENVKINYELDYTI